MRNFYIELDKIHEMPVGNGVLDLGCGVGAVSSPFAENGWNVVAVDLKKERLSKINFNAEIHCENLNTFLERDKRQFPIIIASYVLPFLGKEYKKALEMIYSKLPAGGIFIGTFFGERDAWAKDTPHYFHNREQALADLSKYKILNFQEIDAILPCYNGELKNWHIFEFIVKKI